MGGQLFVFFYKLLSVGTKPVPFAGLVWLFLKQTVNIVAWDLGTIILEDIW